ncbi:MAG: hypothetical protein WBH17_02745, partial [Planktomarina temperata]|uniref:hypothetical protein n=1 Tax=Planktomarina temperata TaxID=1284658 RepID=UPI003C770F82
FKHALTHDTQANNCCFDRQHAFPWNATSETVSFVQARTGYIFNYSIDNEYSGCTTATKLIWSSELRLFNHTSAILCDKSVTLQKRLK